MYTNLFLVSFDLFSWYCILKSQRATFKKVWSVLVLTEVLVCLWAFFLYEFVTAANSDARITCIISIIHFPVFGFAWLRKVEVLE